MLGSIAAGYDGLEFDLVLTADGIPVLSHDPWMHETLCTTADGEALTERVYLQDLTLAEVEEGFLCGGVEDPDNPHAQVVAETPMTFDELLAAMADADPEMLFHIDAKVEPGLTPEPQAFAEAIMPRFTAANLPNPWYVSANLPEALLAFEDWGAEHDFPISSSMCWPRFPPDGNDTAIALKSELAAQGGISEIVHVARDASADGLAVPYQVLDRGRVELARQEGMQIQVWTVNDPDLLHRFQRWPVDSIITDYPGEAE